jgi:aminopeptidase Y
LTLLEIASLLPQYRVNNCVRLAWWAAEEEGLLGSDYYVSVLSEAENLKIRLFMDYDMLASPNFAYQVYNATNAVNPVGSEQLRDLYTEFYEAHGLNFTYIPFDGRSDYDAFIRNGIPGGGIATGAEVIKTAEEQKMFGGVAGEAFDPCYHQLCDDVSNVNLTAWEVNTKVRVVLCLQSRTITDMYTAGRTLDCHVRSVIRWLSEEDRGRICDEGRRAEKVSRTRAAVLTVDLSQMLHCIV